MIGLWDITRRQMSWFQKYIFMQVIMKGYLKMYFNHIENADPEIAALIRKEMDRQENKIEMIASENFVSRAVMEAVGSALTNKYAEGYPGKR